MSLGGDLAGDVVDGAEIGFAGFFGRSANADEDGVAGADGVSDVGGVGDFAGFARRGQDFAEVELVDGDFAGVEHGDAFGVDVGADDFVAGFGETGAGDETYIPTANYGDAQAEAPRV